MKTLVEFFKGREKELRLQLSSVEKRPDEVVKILQIEISKLTDIDGEYVNQLTSVQIRVAVSSLVCLSLLLNSLIFVTSELDPTMQVAGLTLTSDEAGKVAAPIVAGTAIGGFLLISGFTFSQILAPAVLAGFMTGAGGYLVEKFVELTLSKHEHKEDKEQISSNIKVDIDRLLAEIEKQLAEIDDLVSRYTKKEEALPTKLENDFSEFPDALKFLQGFIGDANLEISQLPKLTKKRLELAPQLLREYGIEVKLYNKNEQITDSEDSDDWFEFQPSIYPEDKEYITLRPAFIKNGKVILSGQVIQPSLE